MALKNESSMMSQEDIAALFRGHHEVEECETLENDPQTNFENCKKKDFHRELIPVNELNESNFPDRYRNKKVLEVVKKLTNLTVMVVVKFTSSARPDFSEDKIPYPSYKYRGTYISRNGTGRIRMVKKCPEDSVKTCPCSKCKTSGTPKTSWGEITVHTATHVVFDESEAVYTTCVVDYDFDKQSSLEIQVVKLEEGDINRDCCRLLCVTHDLDLVDRLTQTRSDFIQLCQEVNEMYKDFRDEDKLAIIVSHPHGLPKRVSIGKWTYRIREGSEFSKYSYTNATCPGSSGATVYTMGDKDLISLHVHSGTKDMDGSFNNYSGVGLDKYTW
ncbi:uncharacterized protein LOC131948947 [Physella acuta]|uniref:uncharacterized protein LOC131948947 n=1 Tax=Physella acuta TaxID=109671 RepID=UPI0027DE67D4|nr:uncharacterized protein LOC131948947 [Physella acuta]XP_059166663.1 uncharacterized protein LOC131948947 [Physella acuta]